MERHRCKLCSRNFDNGRALGGHMRSHMMNVYASKISSKINDDEEEKKQQLPLDQKFQEVDDFQSVHSYSSISAPSSSSSEEEYDDEEEDVLLSYGLRRNQKKNEALMDSVVVQDGESETEASRNKPTRRRSKRVRESRVSDRKPIRFFSMKDFFRVKKFKFECDPEPLSSISENSPEEDVAYCLIMLSRDKWEREETQEFQEKNGFSEDSGEAKLINSSNNNNHIRGKYRCETCKRLFKSYQALGGHRARHKKIIKRAPPPSSGGVSPAIATAEEKRYECPFCHRVFSSGQALGGHKRSHFLGSGGISANGKSVVADKNIVEMEKNISRIGEGLNIDLNLPAPIDEDDEIALSAVSDAEFVI